jgi:hypothetical protein
MSLTLIFLVIKMLTMIVIHSVLVAANLCFIITLSKKINMIIVVMYI